MANTLKFKRGLLAGIPTAALGEPLFTTDTFDLYIGNGTGNTRFQKFIASGATTQIIRGDGSLYTFPLAISSPSNGQVLKYNGTSWVNDSDAGITGSGVAGQVAYFTGATTQGGSNNLFWDATNNRLGIGTNTPNLPLSVVGSAIIGQSNAFNTLTIGRPASGNWGANIIINGYNNTFKNFEIGVGSQASNFSITPSTIDGGNTYTTPALSISRTSNVSIGSTTDNGLRFQVTGDGYFSGSVGVGTSTLAGYNFRVAKAMSGSNVVGIGSEGVIDGLAIAYYFNTSASTANTTFTLGNLYHYAAIQGTRGAASTITSQFGFFVDSTLVGGVNNFGFYGNIASGTGRWNLYMNGTAANYLNGALLIGSTSSTGQALQVTGTAIVTSTLTAGSFIPSSSTIPTNGMYLPSANTLGFATASTLDMTLDASGNLGLGVTPSAWSGYGVPVIEMPSGGTFIGQGSVNIGSNFYYSGSNFLYKTSSNASYYSQNSGQHRWFNAPVGTAGNAITFTQAMTLDASGNLGVGVTSPLTRLHLGSTGGSPIYLEDTDFTSTYNITSISNNAGNFNIETRSSAGAFVGADYQIVKETVSSSYQRWFTAAGTERMRLFNTGNLAVGTTTDAGFRLDVNGTMRVSGASTFGGNLGVTLSQNATTWIAVSNPDTDTTTFNTQAGFRVFVAGLHIGSLKATSRNLTGLSRRSLYLTTEGLYDLAFGVNQSATPSFVIDGSTQAATFSSSVTAGGTITIARGQDANVTNVNINSGVTPVSAFQINTDQPNLRSILMARNGYSLVLGTQDANRVTIDTTGAATFSSSVTAGGRYIVSAASSAGTSDISYGSLSGGAWINTPSGTSGYLSIAGNSSFRWYATGLIFYISAAERMRLEPNGLGIGITPAYALDVTGQARISDAIAIGTTPDTNLPFKILKNINSTVGIRFENTSTGANAFAAVQFGQDVSGGTAFANMVYANSAITESGVYKPSGTAIINTGSGGLNFLAVSQPIRFFTSTGNGTLRAEIANDGFINHYTGTAPTTNLTDGYRQYSADITAGNAAPHFRTENGGIIKLYQQTTAVTSATYIGGAGTTVTDLDTFDGYTIPQIVKALRNAGLLA